MNPNLKLVSLDQRRTHTASTVNPRKTCFIEDPHYRQHSLSTGKIYRDKILIVTIISRKPILLLDIGITYISRTVRVM